MFGCARNWELSTAGAATFYIACRGPQLTHHARGAMPIKPENKARYPKDWKQVRERILLRAGNRCEWPACNLLNGHKNPRTGSKVVLTIAHLDHTPENCGDDNLRAWCQRSVRQSKARLGILQGRLRLVEVHRSAAFRRIPLKPAVGFP